MKHFLNILFNQDKVPEYDPKATLDDLYDELHKIKQDIEIVNTSWWQGYKAEMERFAEQCKNQAFLLNYQPAKNEKEIQYKYCMHKVALGMIKAVEASIARLNFVEEEIKRKEGTT